MGSVETTVESTLRSRSKDGTRYSVVSVLGSIDLPYDRHSVLKFIKNIGNLQKYEPKLWRVAHTQAAAEGEKGFYRSTGLFLVIPFHGLFSYELKNDGFHSEMETGLLAGHMNGGFKVTRTVDGATRLRHYEIYELSGWRRPFARIARAYLDYSMRRELLLIADEISHQGLPSCAERTAAA